MALTTMTRRDGRSAAHPDWCARGHRCGLGEHRSTPVTVTTAGCGVVVLTRILAAGGREQVEIRVRIGLAAGEASARAHLVQIVTGFEALLRRVTRIRH